MIFLFPVDKTEHGASLRTLAKFLADVNLKVLDILYCEGGCINGQGVLTKDSLDRRRQKIISHWTKD